MSRIVLLAMVSLSMACSWVPLSDDGEEVRVVPNNEVIDCDRLGNTKATVPRKVWIVPRPKRAVKSELETLARNEGAKLGGNTVTPMGKEQAGKRAYAVYTCED